MSATPINPNLDACEAFVFKAAPPAATPPESYAAVPQQLKDLPNWVVYKIEMRDGKLAKIPYTPVTGRNAKADDPTTWGTFEQAVAAASRQGNKYKGIGFEFGDTPYEGIDFDGLLNADRSADPYALAILAAAGNPYCDVSPSKTGFHGIVEGYLPAGAKNKFCPRDHYGIEIYDTERYFTVTGDHFSGSGLPKVDSDVIYLLVSQFKDEKFKKLWLGDTSGQLGDDSGSDFALMCRLARLTNNDPTKMKAYFSASALGQRDKWRDREDYQEITITKAIAAQPTTSTKTTAGTALEFRLPAVTSGTHRDWVFEPSPGMYEGLFPRGSVSIIAATSGGGKTTFMIQALLAQRAKASFLGHLASAGYSFLILGADRGPQDHTRTMESMHLPLNTFPFERVPMNALDRAAVQTLINFIETHNPIPEIVFIEGLDMMVTKVNDMQIVSSFLGWLQKVAEHYHIAIIGSAGAPKAKEGQTYNITRENILGSGAWGRGSATVITIQFPKGDDTEGQRIVKVLPRRAKPERFMMEFQDGLLVVVQPTAEIETEPEVNPVGRPSIEQQRAIQFLERELQDGSPKIRADLCQKAKELEGINSHALDRAAAALHVIKDDSQDTTQPRKPWRRTWAIPLMYEVGSAKDEGSLMDYDGTQEGASV